MKLTSNGWLPARRLLVLLPLMICVSGAGPSSCQTTGDVPPANVTVKLPAKPDFMSKVAEPDIPVGMDARPAFRVMRAAFRKVNARLDNSGGWYDGVRSRYSGVRKKK